MQIAIQPPIGNTHGPLYTESLLRTIHQAAHRGCPVELIMSSKAGSVGLSISLPDELRVLFLQELQDAYPGTVVSVERPVALHGPVRVWSVCLRLRPDVLAIRTHEAFLDLADDRQFADPVAGLLGAIRSGSSGRVESSLRLVICPASHARIRNTRRILQRVERGFRSSVLKRWYLHTSTSHWFGVRLLGLVLSRCSRTGPDVIRVEDEKAVEQLFECWLVVATTAPINAAQIARRKLREINGAFGRFAIGDTRFVASRIHQGEVRPRGRGFLLTPKELATLWHPLTESGDSVSRVDRSEFREVEPPVSLTSRKGTHGETVLGRVKFRRQQNQFGIAMDDLRRHMIVIGKTGCGKSTFLLNVVRQQIEADRGVVLIDPHGQLADEVLDTVPKRRTNDVIVFDASDKQCPVGFNPLAGPDGADPVLVADGVLTSFKKVFGFDEGTAPRLLHIFRNSLLSLVGTPNASLMAVQRLLVDTNFRRSVVASVKNHAVREFWLTEFNQWNDRDRTQYIASLQNKLGAFTTNERLQAILSGEGKCLNLRHAMDDSRVLICNLSKGTVGHDASTLLGSLLISSLQVAAMSRADTAEADRTDCVIVIDEFHSYLTEGNTAMADALAESRKYRTSYVLSTQMLEQLDAATLAGVLGNCGSTLSMTVGPRDAEVLAELLGSGLTPEHLMRIPKYHGYLRLLVEGAPHTFSMTTLPPPRVLPRRADIVRTVSRQQHGRPRIPASKETTFTERHLLA